MVAFTEVLIHKPAPHPSRRICTLMHVGLLWLLRRYFRQVSGIILYIRPWMTLCVVAVVFVHIIVVLNSLSVTNLATLKSRLYQQNDQVP